MPVREPRSDGAPTQAYRWPPQKRLKLYMVEHDVTRAWLAKQCGLAPVSLSGVLTGRVRPSPRIRASITGVLGQPPGWLFDYIEDPTAEELEQAALWRTTQLDDATIDQLRRLLFPGHRARQTATSS
jgi:transcriptional regulator with XRE-family HTH domain